ncbi:putative bifunctional diguanylate cyclase/phosphodiesterase [Pseudohongiella acticola]|uniref:putative bifunctional diguanylate cyclase/phosphodiesterase n=1 Tax=Pseudohongiella acticola TaxID=1524254 RepID=UPI000A8ADE85|nr:EAL domain-containing protein [Pseudohongiella acticola]
MSAVLKSEQGHSDQVVGVEKSQAGRILVVDDDQRLAESLRELLILRHYAVDLVFGGQAAISRLRSSTYDIVLLDLAMPDVDGHQVLQFIQESKVNALVIVVSGESAVDHVSRALRRGAHDYIKKPYVADELMTTVSNAIRKKRLEDSHDEMQRRMKKSERLHRFLVNNSPDIIFILDQDGRFSFINSKVESVLGYRRSDLLGEHITHIVDTEDQEKARYFFERTHSASSSERTINMALNSQSGNASETRKRHFELTMSKIDVGDVLEAEAGNRYEIYGTARDISDQIEAEEFINFQAYHDILTRLPNRSLFKDRLSVAITHAQRSQEKLAVMFIDLDRFKVINDSLGHTMGDRLLQSVSQRLLSCVRKGDTLSRFGGDEFTLLLPNIKNESTALQVAEKMLESIKTPFEIAGHEIYIGASIGIAVYPDAGEDIEALIKNADIAMYRIKSSGKNGSILFNAEMNGSVTRRHSLEQDLRKALQNNELEICYQPLVDTLNTNLYGVEALIRWNHPRYGRLSPAEFIPIAEDSRLIVEIDRQTMREACLHVGALHQKGHPELSLSINLSPVMVERDDFVQHIFDTLQATAFPPSKLQLEITEGLLLNDRRDIVDKLLQLTNSGINLAIDDFGTGFSSLSYLHKFPINTLKIDRSFVQKLHSESEEACIVSAIVSMAQGLKMNIVAEGVEHMFQFNYLRSLGCNIVQGYLFGEATTLSDVMVRYPYSQRLTGSVTSAD